MSYADMTIEKTDITIGRMTEEDLPAVLAIENASFSKPWSEALFLDEIRKPGTIPLVAKKGARVAGYLCASAVLDEGHVLDLAVDPECRGQGIGRILMRAALRLLQALGCRRVFLEVRASHLGVISFYERSGFRVLETRKCYYVSPVEDAVIMSLRTDTGSTDPA